MAAATRTRGADGLLHREYADRAEYLSHQAAKLDDLLVARPECLATQDAAFTEALAGRIPQLRRGATVLCLGARTGAEVKAFLQRGCFAVGMDINPGPRNQYVLAGDFHRLTFPDGCADAVYTNALDHVFDLPMVLAEVRRVLKPDGLFVAEIAHGNLDPGGQAAGEYESLWWDRAEDVVAIVDTSGFVVSSRCNFTVPWAGLQVSCWAPKGRSIVAPPWP